MGFCAYKSAALSCIAFSYAARIQPTPTREPSSFSYDHTVRIFCGPHIRYSLLLPFNNINTDSKYNI